MSGLNGSILARARRVHWSAGATAIGERQRGKERAASTKGTERRRPVQQLSAVRASTMNMDGDIGPFVP
ncbi:unnamed protein product, partial [Iphiclides podalirius]